MVAEDAGLVAQTLDLDDEFEQHRGHLRAVAYRMLGSISEVDDAVQETWQRYERAETTDVENLRGWLTTVVWRAADNRSDLVVLDASDIDRGPVAIARVPRRVPFGFHGNWVGA